LVTAREEAEKAHDLAVRARDDAHSKYANARAEQASAEATRYAAREELGRLGDEDLLREAEQRSSGNRDAAAEEVERTRLTEAERTIDKRLASARTALSNRKERLSSAEKRLEGLRGQLRSTEGLHNQIVEARRSLEENSRILEEEEVEADAHKYLRELFEECRDSQVRDVMEPVKDRVMDWVHHLGLEDYGDVVFGPAYLPEGLVARDASEDESAVQFTEESYGTREQLSLLVRLALGGVLARDEPQVAILDDPLAHSDPPKHRRMVDILEFASEGREAREGPEQSLGRLQLIVLTCHPERFDHLSDARQIDFVHEACGQ
jgi:DNA repair exonuclease SbcCD ATPase subunit